MTAERVVLLTGWCPNCGETFLTDRGRCKHCGSRAIPSATQESQDLALHRYPLSREARTAIRVVKTPTPKESAVTDTLVPPAPSSNGHAAASAPAKVRLPAIPGVRKLYDQIVGLEDKLRAERARIVERIEAEKQRLADLDRAIVAFHQLPEQIELEPEPQRVDTGKPWHPDYPDGCLDCHRKDRPHTARGYCKTCYPHHTPKANGR